MVLPSRRRFSETRSHRRDRPWRDTVLRVLHGIIYGTYRGVGRTAFAAVQRYRESVSHAGMESLCRRRAGAPAWISDFAGRTVSPDRAARRKNTARRDDLVP